MKTLVTGGCGFIGSHLVDELIECGHEVLVIDDLSTGSIDNLNKKASFLKADFKSSNSLQMLESFSPDIVFHHAAQVSVQRSMENPVVDANLNIIGTVTFLEYCKIANVKKFIYPSSAAVYGNPCYLPIDEKHSVNPVSCYGISKFTPEQYIKVFCSDGLMDYTILRYANVYGERQDVTGEGGVVSIFLNKILNGQNPLIFGDGNQTRDFIYVKDIVAANIFVMDKGNNEVFNVSTGEEVSVNHLFSVIRNNCNSEVAPIYKEQRVGDIFNSYLDNSKLRNLGWQPRYNILAGISDIPVNLLN